ncbi:MULTISPECIES: aspartate aminotransferase family protein [Halocynthiibacter]|uniref:Aspartate aminotransferase family protein n=1 Tax=Halocynthiibacter halioticoli TaxID=2986804 RepID=A0AAE3IZX5_9RHOB|nr:MULTISPECIES: aspartate aminotransferase family protein [Halocynthiibacter]MCV6825099.1 aspartate aminotransferase family protein [Halocynthiibacter halioticoli]MCW4058100.1 aspartate aminotransferase family protein [Halocynthiibacter sp. SDUM655004]
MSHVFHRHTKHSYPTAMRGEGVYLFDDKGKKYLDGSGGAAVSCLGHGDPDVIEAIKAQAESLAYAHTSFFTSEPAEQLADKLVAASDGDFERVYFVSGGSEAVEAALKLARQYFLEKGESTRRRFIARRQSYHGNTLGALATGGNQWRKEPFAPLMVETSLISPCYAYRGQQDGESAFEYGQRVANELEEELLRVGPETVIAFVAEPVVGATLGAVPPVEGYFKRIREICDTYGILLILDEVMCGMGRTGSVFAYKQEGIRPDIVTIAKGLGAGYQPIGAMLCSAEIYAAIEAGTGFFQHGHTYVGHPTACAAANVVVDKLTTGLAARSADMGQKLNAALKASFGQHPNIGDIRGRGLFQGLEIVEDRDTKSPFAPELAINAKIKKAAFANGLGCYPMGGTVDGRIGDHVLLAPPFILTDEHITEITDKLGATFAEVL